MTPWVKYSLWGLGGLAALWVGVRAFAPREVVEGDGDVVPLLTPGMPGSQPAGVSEFPSQVGAAAGITALDLLKWEREDRTSQWARDDKLRGEQLTRDEARDAQRRKDAADINAQRRADAAGKKTQGFLRGIWDDVNEKRIKEGKAPLAVCVRKSGGIGIGAQCKSGDVRYGGG